MLFSNLVLVINTPASPDLSLQFQALGGLPLVLRGSLFPVGAAAAAPT